MLLGCPHKNYFSLPQTVFILNVYEYSNVAGRFPFFQSECLNDEFHITDSCLRGVISNKPFLLQAIKVQTDYPSFLHLNMNSDLTILDKDHEKWMHSAKTHGEMICSAERLLLI